MYELVSLVVVSSTLETTFLATIFDIGDTFLFEMMALLVAFLVVVLLFVVLKW